jgi:hypothetical protein
MLTCGSKVMFQGNLDHSLHALRTQDDTMVEQETFNKQQKLLEKELARVQTQLRISHKVSRSQCLEY